MPIGSSPVIQLNLEFGYGRGLATHAPEQLGQHPVRKTALHREASDSRQRQTFWRGNEFGSCPYGSAYDWGRKRAAKLGRGVCAQALATLAVSPGES